MNYEINKIKTDEFGRPNGILVLDKPIGITSHDLVDKVRREYQTRAVGHAGTLDPFASGKMVILVGKATKLSDKFLGLDKEYIADIVFGVSTTTGDPEGELKDISEKSITRESIEDAIKNFPKEYHQNVPVYSSVKIKGRKLRELARSSDRFEIIDDNNSSTGKSIKFTRNEKVIFESELPSRNIKLYEFELVEFTTKKIEDYSNVSTDKLIAKLKEKEIVELQIAKVRVKCSKGTYIRQLAEDLGEKLGIPAMLIALERTKIGDY